MKATAAPADAQYHAPRKRKQAHQRQGTATQGEVQFIRTALRSALAQHAAEMESLRSRVAVLEQALQRRASLRVCVDGWRDAA